MSTHITEAHRRAFEALTGGRYHNLALISCFVPDELAPARHPPGSAAPDATRPASGPAPAQRRPPCAPPWR